MSRLKCPKISFGFAKEFCDSLTLYFKWGVQTPTCLKERPVRYLILYYRPSESRVQTEKVYHESTVSDKWLKALNMNFQPTSSISARCPQAKIDGREAL
jgi:hypothetical protein